MKHFIFDGKILFISYSQILNKHNQIFQRKLKKAGIINGNEKKSYKANTYIQLLPTKMVIPLKNKDYKSNKPILWRYNNE